VLIDNITILAKEIKLLICDVDGVLTKGEVYLDNTDLELKAFNIKDGLGIKLLQRSGIEIAIITGRKSAIVKRRMQELGITLVYQGQQDKIAAYEELLERLSLNTTEVAFVGDDLPDLPLMNRSAIGIAVADAHQFVRQKADWITEHKGGDGAVRDIADMILQSKGMLEDIHRSYWEQ
jgi:3-deoxy-D-manno-octulosonate 8-phosphate phosphatase (KDO 8-P phosphatase)